MFNSLLYCAHVVTLVMSGMSAFMEEWGPATFWIGCSILFYIWYQEDYLLNKDEDGL